MLDAISAFDVESASKSWCNLPRAALGHRDAIIFGTLTKGELVNAYNKGVVKSKGRPQEIYDELKLAAHEECPYCGGIGMIGALDHFLPKSRFPAYTVLPLNMIPACTDCNSRMGSNFPTIQNLQPMHPYLDEAHFFDEKWTTASVRNLDPIVVDFDVDPPARWSKVDRQRVEQHFEDCNLKKRYRARVWQELAPLISQRKTTLKDLSSKSFSDHLLITANEAALSINGWKRTLYYALANTDWFCKKCFI